MKSTFNICFYAKKDKQKANGAYPLFARITVDGVASRFNGSSRKHGAYVKLGN